MLTRRAFLKYTAGSSLTLFTFDKFGIRQALAQVPGGTLPAHLIPKFQSPLLIPPVMPKSALLWQGHGPPVDYYEISMKQFGQQILPPSLPPTTVWGYGAVSARTPAGRALLLHNAPSLTFEAHWNRPVRVKWINDLKDANGDYVPHLLPVDPTLHWANPPGGTAGRDKRPVFGSTPKAYAGPVPIVTHVHGAVGVGDESDGYAEAWFLPAARNIDAAYARHGTWYDFFAAKAQDRFGVQWGPGFAVSQYPNGNRACTLWYHDHALGMTRLNVYAGPAGFYLVRGGPYGDDEVRDARSGRTARLPGPAPREGDPFPSDKAYHEIPIAIQDRSFNADGSLFYPATREFFDGVAGPYVPESDVSPIWNPEFFGNTLMANGRTWPFLAVERRRYRLRFLNGCQSRFLILDFGAIPGVEAWQIGNDGGFIEMPVNLAVDGGNRLLLGPAERADVIVDFGGVPAGHYVLANVGPDEPFGGGVPGVDFEAADPQGTGQVMQFRVLAGNVADRTTPPVYLQLPALPALPNEDGVRRLALLEAGSEAFDDAPVEAHLGTLDGDPNTGKAYPMHLHWGDPVTDNPQLGATELWEFYNATPDAHPIHVHEVAFEIVGRQAITLEEEGDAIQVAPGSSPRGPEPGETGFKDTVIAYPGEVTRVRAQFNGAGQFVWHCHIVEHEDNEMMRPYRIGPVQPGQPEAPQ